MDTITRTVVVENKSHTELRAPQARQILSWIRRNSCVDISPEDLVDLFEFGDASLTEYVQFHVDALNEQSDEDWFTLTADGELHREPLDDDDD